jgi:hypothetical protein
MSTWDPKLMSTCGPCLFESSSFEIESIEEHFAASCASAGATGKYLLAIYVLDSAEVVVGRTIMNQVFFL